MIAFKTASEYPHRGYWKARTPMMDATLARALWDYDQDTGVVRWRVAPHPKISIGSEAGSIKPNGYRDIVYDRKTYKAHRLAWLIVYGFWPKELDHHDRDRSNNRLLNLREATNSQNQGNSKQRSSNGSPYKGISFDKRQKNRRRPWRAHIRVRGRQLYLGSFATPEAAHVAYCLAARQHFGEFAHTG